MSNEAGMATPHAELIAELMNPNNPKNEREHAAVRMIERLQEALPKPVLQDIEQYRLQMAGISTAAIGYWKEGDNIHPDYDTLALRDVAKLYAKYDALYKAQPVPHAVIAGALFDFMGWLTTRGERLVLSASDEAGPAVDAIRDFAKMRGLSLDDAKVQDWNTTPPQRTEQEYESVLIDGVAYTIPSKVAVEILGLHLDLLQLKQEQEPVAWGVDWGRAGDIPCVSIIKRLPNGGIEVVAVEYATYTFKEKNT